MSYAPTTTQSTPMPSTLKSESISLADGEACTRRLLLEPNAVECGGGIKYSTQRDMFFRVPGASCTSRENPLSVCVSLGSLCNLRCKVCLNPSDSESFSWQGLSDLIQVFESLAPLRVTWSGGEPTLYEYLPKLLEAALCANIANVVATNMTQPDCLGHLAGQFFYAVSIYGVETSVFSEYTGHDRFNSFVRHFEHCLNVGHKICASIRLQDGWRSYLPEQLEWLRKYPIRKLVLSNTLDRGRNLLGAKAISGNECRSLRSVLADARLPFPVIYPQSQTSDCIQGGYVVLEADSRTFLKLNGRLILTPSECATQLKSYAAANVKLFTLQHYQWSGNEPNA